MSKYLYFALTIAVCSSFLTGCQRGNNRPPPAPPKVTTSTVTKQDTPIYIDTIGQAIGMSTVFVRPQVAGKLIKANIEQGALVKEGEVIYEVDPRPFLAILEETIGQLAHDEALLKYAQQTVERYKPVVEDDFISILTYEQYISTYEAAKAQVEIDKAAIVAAKLNVEFCHIVAPITGKISYFNVYVGNILSVDDPNQITTILPLSPIDILFSLPQSQFELIRGVQGTTEGWRFVATLPELPNCLFEGSTFFFDNEINQNTGTILFKGRVPNDHLTLWPGEFMRVKVLYKMAPGALIVPPGAVLMGKDGPYIYTVDKEGKAVAINVTVLTRTEEYIAIQSDKVHEGDTVIVDGQINVAPGIKVSATPIKKS